jgi:protein phosphatase
MKSLVFSHKGNREVNQDYILIQNITHNEHILLIADGMGGYEQGDVAAKIVAENIHTYLSNSGKTGIQNIQTAVNKSNLAIKQLTENSQKKIGATVGGIILKEKEAICFWVGDVKIFHFQKNKLQFESNAHTLMNEVIESGAISDINQIVKYKHVVTRSIQGDVEFSKIDSHTIETLSGDDLIIICSDGVHDKFNGIQIQQILNTSDGIEQAMWRIEKMLKKEAKDNYSMISAIM